MWDDLFKKNINYNDIYTNPYWDDKDSNDPPIDYMRLGFLRGIHILKELKKAKNFSKKYFRYRLGS